MKTCPKGDWLVKEWAPDFSTEREKSQTELRWDCVPESDLSAVPHAFWANYPSALARMKECFPDSEVVGVNCLPLIYQFGSLHCVTMQLPEGVL